MIYTFALPKGGTGKTICAAEGVYYLSRLGRRVLAIDLDQQGNLSHRLGLTKDAQIKYGSAQVLTATADAVDAAVPALSIPADVVPHVLVGTHELAAVESQPPADLVTTLRDHLPSVAGEYDDIVIDTPPSATGLALAGLAAADVVIAPVATATESYDQLERLDAILTVTLGKRINPGIRIGWVMPTRFDQRRILDREVVEAITKHYPGRVTAPIREAVTVKDAYTAALTISAYRPTAAVAMDYAAAFAQIMPEADL